MQTITRSHNMLRLIRSLAVPHMCEHVDVDIIQQIRHWNHWLSFTFTLCFLSLSLIFSLSDTRCHFHWFACQKRYAFWLHLFVWFYNTYGVYVMQLSYFIAVSAHKLPLLLNTLKRYGQCWHITLLIGSKSTTTVFKFMHQENFKISFL